jgi:hypothetical protein
MDANPPPSSLPTSTDVSRELLPVGGPLRKAYRWLGVLADQLRKKEEDKRREELRTQWTQLLPSDIARTVNAMENTQKQIDKLERLQARRAAILIGHWAHTGVSRFMTRSKKVANVIVGALMSLNPNSLLDVLTPEECDRFTTRVLDVRRLLAEAEVDERIRDAIKVGLEVSQLRIGLRRPGEKKKGEETEEE